MWQVSERSHYGLRAMTELAKAYGGQPLSLAQIAEVERLPAGYLEQLAMPLRRAGLIEGKRGPHGGYELAKPPAEVTVGAVVRALEGPVAPVGCLTEDYVRDSCVREPVCLSRSVWQRVKESVEQVLDSTTLADLCAPAWGPADAFIPVAAIQGYGPSPHTPPASLGEGPGVGAKEPYCMPVNKRASAAAATDTTERLNP